MAYASHKKLRRLVTRADKVLARHKGKATWVAAIEESLAKSGPEFAELYDTGYAKESARKLRTESNHASATTLLLQLRGWAALASHHISTIRKGEFGDTPNVPDDVITDVAKLIATVEEHEQQNGQPFSWSPAMRAELTAAVEAAKVDWGLADTTEAEFAQFRLAVREAGHRFHRDLVTFRTLLERLLGREHPDYRKLRLTRKLVDGVEVEDDGDEVDEDDEVSEAPALSENISAE